MKILLTGVTGYIGRRLLPILLNNNHTVYCCVRDKARFSLEGLDQELIEIIEVDFLKKETLKNLPKDIDAAYYLIHSMTSSTNDFTKLETETAKNFKNYINTSTARQIIFLGGISNSSTLSKHLESRMRVESILNEANCGLTALRAGIIVGSGSASFEIIRDLVEKLPFMITPRWVNSKCQPIAIKNVIEFLNRVLLKENLFNKQFDISGPETFTYKEMLLLYAKARGLKRVIFTVPIMTPRLSSYWLYFITATSYKLAVNLVNSMKIDVVATPNTIAMDLEINLISYNTAIENAFARIEQNMVISSWKDAIISSNFNKNLSQYITPPTNGCFIEESTKVIPYDTDKVLENIWAIGGYRGWYYATWLWKIRGFIDKLFGGVGLRRGRTNQLSIYDGDSIDFWRVLKADKVKQKLLLYAEMKLPGEAWLEFSIVKEKNQDYLKQRAIFRPIGIWGRLYWYLTKPLHFFIFKYMPKRIIDFKP